MKKTYFLLEDHSFMRFGVSTWISENSSWKCAGSADTIASAIEQLKHLYSEAELPTLLITDINLGNSKDNYSGLEFISDISRIYSSIKIICYTMYKSPGIISDAIRRGAKGFVCKNTDEKFLLLCMEKVFSGEDFIDETLRSSVKTYKDALLSLTSREKQIFDLIIQKKSNERIALELGIQKRGVESYCSRIYNKLDCNNRDKIIEVYSI